MIPIDQLVTRPEVQAHLVPDPHGPVTKALGILRLLPAAPAGFRPELLTDRLWAAQVRAVAVVHRVRQIDDLLCTGINRGSHSDVKDHPDFKFLPTFLADVQHHAIERHAHPRVRLRCPAGRVPVLGQGIGALLFRL
jgi:hypothetical protein